MAKLANLQLVRQNREAIDHGGSLLEHFLYYGAALLRASREIESLSVDTPVVADRHIASTAAYHAPWIEGELVMLDSLPIILPEATILLSAGEQIRRVRLERRDGNGADWWFDTPAALRRAEEVLRTFATFEV